MDKARSAFLSFSWVCRLKAPKRKLDISSPEVIFIALATFYSIFSMIGLARGASLRLVGIFLFPPPRSELVWLTSLQQERQYP